MTSPSTLRTVRRVRAILAALAATAMAVCAAAAPPTPYFATPASTLSDLAGAGVQVPEAVAAKAVRAYLDAYAEVLAKAVEEGARICPSNSPFSPNDEALLGVRDARRLADFETRLAAMEAQLREAFFAQIAAGSPPESQDAIRACEALRKLREAERRLQGGMSIRFGTPDDISGWLRLATAKQAGKEGASMEERRRVTTLAAVNADQRIAATMVAIKAARDDRERKAQRAEELGVVGKSLQQLNDERVRAMDKVMREAPRVQQGIVVDQRSLPPDIAGEFMQSPAALAVGGTAWQALGDAQLATYRAMEPQLTERDRERLRDFWMPRLMGLRDSIAGLPGAGMAMNGRSGYVQAYLRMPGLDDAGRDKARAICRTWLKDDAAIVDAGFASLLKTGKSGDVDDKRRTRAMQLRADLAAIRGLEWLSPNNQWPKIPEEAPAALSPADIAEFGAPADDYTPGAHLADDPEAQRDFLGLPRGISARDGEQLAALLRLDDAQRAILMAVLEDARTSWETTIEPLVRAGHPATPPIGRAMDEAAYRAYTQRTRQAERARSEAWIAAKKADDAFFEALAAALGDRCDRSVLAFAHASRQARRLAAWEGGYHANTRESSDLLELGQIADLPTALLELPVADDARARACAASVAMAGEWIVSVNAWADTQDALHSTPPSTNADLDEAKSRMAQARRACVEKATRLDAAIAAALPEGERQRWSDLVLALRFPQAYRDLRPFRKAVGAALACVPAERSAEVRARLDAIDAELATRIRGIGAHAASTPERSDASYQSQSLAEAEIGFAAAQVVQALPPECRGAFELRSAARYLESLAQISQPATNSR